MDGYTGDSYSMVFSFYKVGEDNNKILKNEQYEIYSIDDVPTGLTLDRVESGRFKCDEGVYGPESINLIEKVTPNVVKDMLNSIHTITDVRTLASNYHFATSESNVLKKVNVYFDLPIKLKQLAVENGYKRRDIFIQGHYGVSFKYDPSTNEILSKTINVYQQSLNGIYSDSNNFENISSMEDILNLQFESFTDENYSCINSNAGLIITNFDRCEEVDYALSAEYYTVPYFLAEKGVVKLEITNTVNDLTKYNASSNKNLEYKIVVKNTGEASSSENIITTNVPQKVVVDENNISNNGVYNKTEKTITWRIDSIDANEQVTVTYKAIAPESASGEELIGNSSVVSTQVTERVFSNNTIVTLDKIVEIIKNPNTGTSMIYIPNTNIGMPISILFIIVLVLSLISMMILNIIKKKKNTSV